jgi:hypothetical protein
MRTEGLLPCSQEPAKSNAPYNISQYACYLWRGTVTLIELNMK